MSGALSRILIVFKSRVNQSQTLGWWHYYPVLEEGAL